MLSCICASSRTYEEVRVLNQPSSLRYATPKVGDIVTRKYGLVPFVTYPIRYSFFCPPSLFFHLCGFYLTFGVLGWRFEYPVSACSRYAYRLAACQFPPNNVPHRRGILFLCTVRCGFDCRRGQEVSLFCKTHRPALGPTKPPIQWVTGGSLTGSKATGRRTPPPSAEVTNEWSSTSTPYILPGVDRGIFTYFTWQ